MRRTYLFPRRDLNPLRIPSQSLGPATTGVAYSQQMFAVGGFPPYTWAIQSQTGTNGWVISAGGVLSGTPTSAETDTITFQVTDTQGTVALSAPLSLTVSSGVPVYNFDHFISPTGSNANPGTLLSPWRLDAITLKRGSYTQLGVIYDQGVYSLPAMGIPYQNAGGGFSQPILNAATGTAGAPIVIASCNSSGVYVGPPNGLAVLDGGINPGRAYQSPPVNSGPFCGSNLQSSNTGYCTWDGFEIRYCQGAGILMGSQNDTISTNMVVKNCLVHHVVNLQQGSQTVSSYAGGGSNILTVNSVSAGTVTVGDAVFLNNTTQISSNTNGIAAYGTGGTTGTGGVGTYWFTLLGTPAAFTNAAVSTSQTAGNNTAGIALYALSTGSGVFNTFIYDVLDYNTALNNNYRAIGLQTWFCNNITCDQVTIYATPNTGDPTFPAAGNGPISGIEHKNTNQYALTNTRCYIHQANAPGTGSGSDSLSADIIDGVNHFFTATNNILINNDVMGCRVVAPNAQGYVGSPFTWAFNTCISSSSGANTAGGLVRYDAKVGGVQHYCNIYTNIHGATPLPAGVCVLTADGVGLLDYDVLPVFGTNGQVSLAANGQPVPPATSTTVTNYKLAMPYNSSPAWTSFLGTLSASCIGRWANVEIGAPTFVNASGTFLKATDWQLANTSAVGKGTGSTTGQSGGGATDKGAWGSLNGVAPGGIGCQWKDPF